MDALTLTGATLLDKKDNKHGRAVEMTTTTTTTTNTTTTAVAPHGSSHHDHSHGHSHGHGNSHSACCSPQPLARPVVTLQMPADELVKQEPAKVIQALTVVTRMGDYDILEKLMEAWKKHLTLENMDKKVDDVLREIFREHGVLDGTTSPDARHTLLHWASKRKDEPRFAHFWVQYISVFTKTTDTTGMTPLHWACTEGPNLPVIRFLIEQGKKGLDNKNPTSLMETDDASGCSPLLIAAQYGQVEAVAYLIQKGTNRHALDSNRDSSLHWAAYKGNVNVMGLLLFYDVEDRQQHAVSADVYGQTPLHLASLRGHKGVCRLLVEHLATSAGRVEVRRLLQMPDKNGRTPEALARHKGKESVAHLLHEFHQTYVSAPQGSAGGITREIKAFVKNLTNVHRWKVCLGIAAADDEMDEAPHVPFYYVAFQIVGNVVYYFTVLMPIFNVGEGVLFDYTFLHLWNICLIAAITVCWIKTWRTDPGRLVSKEAGSKIPPSELSYWRKLYEDTLEAYADEDKHESVQAIQLCHTCHLARPPRSKHDRFMKSCVLLFDHHCPFVGNTVGLYNYKWFYFFLVSMTFFFIDMWFLMILYWQRVSNLSVASLLIGIYFASHILMTGGMLIYHTQLVVTNLTTNEHINLRRYDYLWTKESSGQRKYRNPWMRGYWNNVVDRFFPTQASYRLPEQYEGLLSKGKTGNDHQRMLDRVV